MKKITIYLLAILILVITSSTLFAQVTFRMKRPPLNQLKSSDLWNATIINTGEAFTAYIYGSMKNNEDGEMIATGQTMTFEVKKGTTNFKISDLPKIPDVSYLSKDPKYKKSFMNTGGAPPGDYKICCELRFTNNNIAGEDCFDQKIAGGDAPRLISPSNEEQLKIDNPVFTWMHIKSPTSNLTYTLRIVELNGDQSSETAMLKNKAFFEKEGISQTLFQYPSSATKFEAGKKYAWCVKIGDLQSDISIFDRWGNMITSNEKDICSADSVIINTGYNHNTNSLYPMNSYDNFWIVTADPYTSTTEPRPACVLSSNNPWGASVMTNTARWINFHPISSNSDNVSFDYRFRFCLGSNYSNVVINIQMLCDDEGTIFVNGNNAGSTPPEPSSGGVYNHNTISTFQINNQNFFQSGCNEIIVRVKNVFAVATGLIINGSIKATTGLRKMTAGCCPCLDPTGCINGFKWNDLNGDGIRQNTEPLLPNWQINLSNGHTTLTDTLGYYFFTELPAGTYTVTETNQSGCTQTFPVSGSYTVNLGSSETVSNINFGNNCTSSPCDSFKAVQVQNPLGNCCWSLNLTHPSSTANITGIQFSALSPNSFVTGSSQLGSSYNSGWIYTSNTPQEFGIKKLGSGSIPTGQLNGFFNFCLNKLSSPQHVVVKWLRNDSSVVCTDTVTLNCDIPCVTFNNDTLICNGNNYNWNFSFVNNSTFPINKIEVVSTNPSGVNVLTPTMTLMTTVNQGQTSNLITNSISGLAPNSSACIVLKFTSPDGCCWCYDTLCVKAPSCVCNDVGASVTGDPMNCCFNLNLQNNYLSNYFTQVRLRTLESGVYFSTWNTNTSNNWYSTNTFPDNVINLIKDPSNFPNSYIPTGNLSNVMNFCLTNYTSSTQHIILEWMRNDSLKCTDTLLTNCIPPPPVTPCVQLINDSLTCQPDGTFKYTFYVKNNSSHTTTGFQFNPISPSGLSFNPANFSNVTIAPNMISPQQSMIVSGVTSGSQFCFNISLYEHILISGQQYYDWCCYSSEICKTVPNCNVGQGCINSKLDSIWCIKDPTGIKKYDYTISLTNLKASSGSYVLSNSCGTLLGNNTGTIPANSTISVSGQFTTTQTGNCCIIAKMFIYSPVKTDSCLTELCFTLPKCDSTINTDCDCKGNWKSKSRIDYTDGKTNFKKDIKCFDEGLFGPIKSGTNINYSASPYVCSSDNCAATYIWNVVDLYTNTVVNSGTSTSFPVTFPAPPEGRYRFTVFANCGGKNCDSCGFNFYTVGKSDCDCGDWKSKEIQVEINYKTQHPIICGDNLTVDLNSVLILTFPDYVCKPKDCTATYSWDLKGGSGIIPVNESGTDNPFKYDFKTPGSYNLSFKSYCGGKVCDSCVVKIEVPGNTHGDCNCGQWVDDMQGFKIHGINVNPQNVINAFVPCGKTYSSIFQGVSLDFVSQTYKCNGDDNCKASYKWIIEAPSGTQTSFNTISFNNFVFNEIGTYKVSTKVLCNGNECDKCTSYIKVIKRDGDRK